MWNIIWIIIIGFIAGLIARALSPGPNDPKGFLLTTVLGIVGAFIATFIGQSIGWYRLDQGAGLIGATVGAMIVCSSGIGSLLTHSRPGQSKSLISSRDSRDQAKEADMGLSDILTGMMNGPRGERQPSSSGSGGGMSPIMMALLGLLAYKAFKGRRAQGPNPGAPPRPAAPGATASAGTPGGGLDDILGGLFGGKPGSTTGAATTSGKPSGAPGAGAQPGGSLSDLLPGGLGGLLGGAAAGSVLSGGLANIIKELEESGHGRVAQSWVGTGPNEEIPPKDLANALGGDTLNTLSKHTGLNMNDLLAGLSQHLPDLVDQLTPKGRLPSEDEAARMV